MLVLSDLPEETLEDELAGGLLEEIDGSAEAGQEGVRSGGARPEGVEPEGAGSEEAGSEKARQEEAGTEETGTAEAEENTTPSIIEQEGNTGNERTNAPVVVPEAG